MNPKDLKFKCLQCGECCADTSDFIFGPQKFGHNSQGKFVRNPKTSVPVHYTEAARIYRQKDHWNGKFPKLFPLLVLFLRNKPVGYIFYYQIEAGANSNCAFYDTERRGCAIYEDRPAVCCFYPLMFDINDPEVPYVLLECEECKKHAELYPDWDKEQMRSFFGESYDAMTKSIFKWHEEYREILERYSHLFLKEIEVNPNTIASYTYKNFQHFLKKY